MATIKELDNFFPIRQKPAKVCPQPTSPASVPSSEKTAQSMPGSNGSNHSNHLGKPICLFLLAIIIFPLWAQETPPPAEPAPPEVAETSPTTLPDQVVIELKVIERNKGKEFDVGIIWEYTQERGEAEGDKAKVQLPSLMRNNDGSLFKSGDYSQAGARIVKRGWPLKYGTLNVDIDTLISDSRSELLANPVVTVKNGATAVIQTGDIEPYLAKTVVGSTVVLVTNFLNTGINIKVTPTILEDNFVALEVEPSISSVVKKKKEGGYEQPVVSTISANTRVIVKSGFELVIGGLYKTVYQKASQKIPGFGDIPLLGMVFRNKATKEGQKEIILWLRPIILKGGQIPIVAPKSFQQWSADQERQSPVESPLDILPIGKSKEKKAK